MVILAHTGTQVKSTPNREEQSLAEFIQNTQEKKALAPGPALKDEQLVGFHAQLDEAFQDAGIDGFNTTLKALLNTSSYLNQVISAPAREDDPDFTKNDQGKKILRHYILDEIDDLPDQDQMVRSLLWVASVSLWYGESNTGKTFHLLHMAQCVARGMPWFGREVVKQGKVLYIYSEGFQGLKRRARAWNKKYGLPNTPDIHFVRHPVQLINERDLLIDTATSDEYALIIIDTFSNSAIGVQQNDSMEVGKALKTAHDIVRLTGAHVAIAHHTNKEGKFNGAMAFMNHVDTMFELAQVGKSSPIILTGKKQREEFSQLEMAFTLEVQTIGWDDTTMQPITSCVPVLCDHPTREQLRYEGGSQQSSIMLDILKAGPLSQNKWRESAKKQGIGGRAFTTLLKTLECSQMVRVESRGQALIYSLSSMPIREDFLEDGDDDE